MKSRKPARLRLSRRKGFDLQKLSRETNGLEAIVVSRPSPFGNPFKLDLGRERAVGLHRKWLEGTLSREEAALADASDTLDKRRARVLAHLATLTAKNLACWCPQDAACHADVLLELANTRRSTEPARDAAR
jgi:hypothetical protein